jgi:hypothetical protein
MNPARNFETQNLVTSTHSEYLGARLYPAAGIRFRPERFQIRHQAPEVGAMAADDFYAEAGRSRLQDIAVECAEALASLERAKSMGDYSTAGQAVQTIANLDSEQNNLVGRRHVR